MNIIDTPSTVAHLKWFIRKLRELRELRELRKLREIGRKIYCTILAVSRHYIFSCVTPVVG
ncbi:MAG: hypothetical protein F6J96_15665 [Symploca sp. SIO1C2]|nr:hypothetical protein [Symploca sp. SIO1C2]